MKFWKKIIPLSVLLCIASSVLPASGAPAYPSEMEQATPIEHLIVVIQQNHTFDNYFGTYSEANGIPPNTCMPVALPNSADSAAAVENDSCVTPFNVGSYPLTDLSHSDTVFSLQYRSGEMNGFVDTLNRINQDGALSMGYFDDKDIPFYWNLADEYVLFDNYFSSAHTGSITNRMFAISGRPGSEANRIPTEGFGDIPTIFDKLQERDISWKFYIKDYDPTLNYRSLEQLDYLPPQVQWVPLLSFDRFLDTPELFSRIVDLDEYYSDLANGTLPAVSYVLLLGATEHPISDLELGQRTSRTMLQTLMQSDAWDSTAFLITYDDWGGWYDHVPPPQVDKYGYGFRVPTLLVSPYARKGHIDHTQLDHTSILKFIETNWDIPPLARRDAKANNLTSAFDFSSSPRPPVFISSIREQPEPRIEPRRIVIYLAYGAAMLFAFIIFARLNWRKDSFSNPSYLTQSEEEIKS